MKKLDKPEYKKRVLEIVDTFIIEYNIEKKENEIKFPEKFKKARDLILNFKEKDKIHLDSVLEFIKDLEK